MLDTGGTGICAPMSTYDYNGYSGYLYAYTSSGYLNVGVVEDVFCEDAFGPGAYADDLTIVNQLENPFTCWLIADDLSICSPCCSGGSSGATGDFITTITCVHSSCGGGKVNIMRTPTTAPHCTTSTSLLRLRYLLCDHALRFEQLPCCS